MDPAPPSLLSLERQLEGRWAHVERARECNTVLLRQLGSPHWRRELRARPGPLQETRRREAELQAVLTYVEQRSHQEQWPSAHPGLLLVRALRVQRSRLEATMRRRLSRPLLRTSSPFLALLERLESLALAPAPGLPSPDELVLLRQAGWSGGMPGHTWLTTGRVLWQPWLGEPVQIPLSPLAPGAVSLTRAGFGVGVEGAERLVVTSGWRAAPLARLIELCRRLPHLRQARTQVDEAVVCPAYGRSRDYETELRWGLTIFRPGYVAFLPTHRLTPLEHLRRLVGREPRPPDASRRLWQEALVEHLRRLPPEEFDSALRALVETRGGQLWPSRGVHRAPDEAGEIRLEHGAWLLGLEPGARREVLQPFLERHFPFAAAPDPARPPRGEWRKLPRERLGLLVGGVLTLGHLLPSSGPPSLLPGALGLTVLSLLGRGLFGWACMRCAKAKGHPPLLGLLLSLTCVVGLPFFLFLSKKRPRVQGELP